MSQLGKRSRSNSEDRQQVQSTFTDGDNAAPRKRLEVVITTPPRRDSEIAAPKTPLKPIQSANALEAAFDEAMAKQYSPEMVVLSFMRHYDFSMADLEALLKSKSLNVSFSRVTYSKIAPLFGLSSIRQTKDMKHSPSVERDCRHQPSSR
ncbi:hypothetical protein BDD12DRAFT_824984 [Trichophaea hybrida]|nr:hypothetical protein BDD12DRAFT_824984 [Trichophaea hybrida]